MNKSSIFFLSLVFATVAESRAELFSSVDKNALSYDYTDSIRSIVQGKSRSFLSRPNDFSRENAHEFVVINHDDQHAGVNITGVTGFGRASGESMSFVSINGIVTLHSPHLSAKVALNTYTVDDLIQSYPEEIAYERFIVGHEVPIDGAIDFRFGLPEAYLTFTMKNLALDVGKKKLRWGPGYKGTLSLSGTGFAPFYYYHLAYKIGDFCKASSFLCGYDDEQQFSSELIIRDTLIIKATGRSIKVMPPRYGAGQRLDLRLGRHLQIGFFELVDFFGTNELNRFANPLSFYYIGNNASGTNNANMMGGMDANWLMYPLRIYLDFLNDDITLFEKAGNPNKYAWQIGSQYFSRSRIPQIGIEYTHVTRYAYGHSRVLNRHTFWHNSLGWPWGNYQDVVNAHAIFKLYNNFNLKLESNFWISGNGKLSDEWYTDNEPNLDAAPYWPQNGDHLFSFIASFDYKPVPWILLNGMVNPVIRKGAIEPRLFAFLSVSIPKKFVRNYSDVRQE